MKKFIIVFLPLCFLYFIIGGILFFFNKLDVTIYLNISAIAGSLASLIGLISFIRPAFTRTDIQNIEIDSLVKIKNISNELETLELSKNQTKGEINKLKQQRKEMELLVRKASMALFLKEQYKFNERIIIKYINDNSEIKNTIDRLIELEETILILDNKIEKDKNVKLLKEIIENSKIPNTFMDDAIIRSNSKIIRILLKFLKAYFNMLLKI